jgi:hypothetical protein
MSHQPLKRYAFDARSIVIACVAWSSMVLGSEESAEDARSVDYHDLIETVDIGASPEMDFDGLAVSPDRGYVAFETTQNLVASNVVESRWRIVSLNDERHASWDLGPSSTSSFEEDRRPQRPVWSRDSRWILYRARFGSSTQLWRSHVDGTRREQLTTASSHVTSFVLSRDGERLIYATRDSMVDRLESEGVKGYLYDERFSPLLSTRPIDDSQHIHVVWVYDLTHKTQRLASIAERDELEQSHPSIQSDAEPPIRWRRKAGLGDAAVWLEDSKGRSQADPERPLTVVRTGSAAERVPCRHERCTGYFKGLWISEDGRTVYFLRWVGPYSYGAFGIYAWEGGSNIREVLKTYDSLEACSMVALSLLCSHEGASKPRDVVSIDLKTGAQRKVFDPNPQFDRMRFGEVVPLTWTDGKGVEAYGRLVKPIDYRAGQRYPLVIVQYRSRGFLRGGTGDECPIHVLASKGFAVLSFHRPEDWDVIADYVSTEDAETRFWRDLHDRRRVASVLEAGVKLLDNMGIVDASRVGIHGLSDGANTTGYLLIHSPRAFAAASVAGTYWNPGLYYLFGPKLQDRMRWFGLPFPGYDGTPQPWKNISIAANASVIQTPILIQVADSELLPESETFTALQLHSKPVEMHVFPNEFHVKVQPAHRLNIYQRNVQWFQFWLQDLEDPSPVDATQYGRWRKLRELKLSSSLQTPSPFAQGLAPN